MHVHVCILRHSLGDDRGSSVHGGGDLPHWPREDVVQTGRSLEVGIHQPRGGGSYSGNQKRGKKGAIRDAGVLSIRKGFSVLSVLAQKVGIRRLREDAASRVTVHRQHTREIQLTPSN